MDYLIERKNTISLAGYTKSFNKKDENDGKKEFWREISNNDALNKIHEVKIRGPIFDGQIVAVTKEIETEPDRINYFIGTEYDARKSIYALENLTIKESEWVIFRCAGAIPKAMEEAKIEIFNKTIPFLNYKINDKIYIEVYSDENRSNEDYRFEIWVQVQE